MADPTPGPWWALGRAIHPEGDGLKQLQTLAVCRPCGNGGAEANAEFIVRAVNAHDALVEALRCATNRLETIRETHPTFHLDDDIARGRSALALAAPPQPEETGGSR